MKNKDPPIFSPAPKKKHKKTNKNRKKTMSKRSAEEILLQSIFTPAEWVPLELQPSTHCSPEARKIIENAPTDVRDYLLVNDPKEALDLFLTMSTGWAEGTEKKERPCCEEDLEYTADKFLLSRERTSYRADAWSIAAECEHEWDWDWFPRTYMKNKIFWLANAFESLKVQKLTQNPKKCANHKNLTREEREIMRKVVDDVLRFYNGTNPVPPEEPTM